MRQYLADVNKDRKVRIGSAVLPSTEHFRLTGPSKVLEYTLFCPGIFTNYYTYPYPSAKHLNIFELNVDFHNRRAMLLEGGDNDRVSLTTVQDLAGVVGRAIEFDGEWPVMGGINGCELSIKDVIAIGERVRGGMLPSCAVTKTCQWY